MCVCVHIHKHMYRVYGYICTHIHTNIHIPLEDQLNQDMHTCICIYVCRHAYIYVCTCIYFVDFQSCNHINLHIYPHTHKHIHTPMGVARMHVCHGMYVPFEDWPNQGLQVCVCICMYVCMYVCTYVPFEDWPNY